LSIGFEPALLYDRVTRTIFQVMFWKGCPRYTGAVIDPQVAVIDAEIRNE
jgi:hypothetical protein